MIAGRKQKLPFRVFKTGCGEIAKTKHLEEAWTIACFNADSENPGRSTIRIGPSASNTVTIWQDDNVTDDCGSIICLDGLDADACFYKIEDIFIRETKGTPYLSMAGNPTKADCKRWDFMMLNFLPEYA